MKIRCEKHTVLFSEYFTLISFETRVIHWDKGVYEGFHM